MQIATASPKILKSTFSPPEWGTPLYKSWRQNARGERPLMSLSVSVWLFVMAFYILLVLAVGGATRLTESGLSITRWDVLTGIMPPLTSTAWTKAFADYQTTYQYQTLNPNMSLDAFKTLFWWEWGHRLLARLLGGLFLIPFTIFMLRSEIPTRLIWRCVAIFLLICFQGLVGWLMVSTGLFDRVRVSPVMLAFHLGTALALLGLTVWTALEASSRPLKIRTVTINWRLAGGILVGLIWLQCLLGALLSGSHAGLIFNDWPLMNGQWLPPSDVASSGFLNDAGAIQFAHRCNAYISWVYTVGFSTAILRTGMSKGVKRLAGVLVILLTVQGGLGIATLMSAVPLDLALAHQFLASICFSFSLVLIWCLIRQPGETVSAMKSLLRKRNADWKRI